MELIIAEALSLRWSMELVVFVRFSLKQIAFSFTMRGEGFAIFFPPFDCVDFSFVRRDGNSAADYTARNASSFPDHVWVEEGPPDLVPFLDADVLASMHV